MSQVCQPVTASRSTAGADRVAATADGVKALHVVGLRATQQRLDLLALVTTLSHPTVDSLWTVVRRRDTAVSTVYRTLETLERAGLVISARFGKGPTVYHHATHEHHDHQVCEGCGVLNDTQLRPTIDAHEAASAPTGPDAFWVSHIQLLAIGTCAACRAATGVTRPSHLAPEAVGTLPGIS